MAEWGRSERGKVVTEQEWLALENPGGRLVILEYAKENSHVPVSEPHKMSFDEIRSEIEPLGFELDRVLDFLPMQHGLIFTPAPGGPPPR